MRDRSIAFTAFALLAYGAAFGLGIYTSVHVLGSGSTETSATWGWAGIDTFLSLVAIGFATPVLLAIWTWPRRYIAVYASGGVDGQLSARSATTALTIGAVGLYMVALAITQGIVLLVDWAAGSPSTEEGPAGARIITSILAGIDEEVIVVALLVSVIAMYTSRWWIALLILVPFRLAYHLYYGWPVVGLIVWAAVSAAIIWRWRSPRIVVGFVIVHALWDALLIVPDLADGSGLMVGYALVGAALLAMAVALDRAWYAAAPIVGFTRAQWHQRSDIVPTAQRQDAPPEI